MSQGPNIVVVGSAVVDQTFRVGTLPMPGESAVADAVGWSLGGKGANQAAAAALLGARVLFLGCVGDDDGGRQTGEDLARRGIDARLMVAAGVPTGHAAVMVDETGENLIAVHLGANARLTAEHVAAARDDLVGAAVYVAQLEVPPAAIRAGLELVRENEEVVTILNVAPMLEEAAELLPLFDVAVVNRVEAEMLAGVGIQNLDDALAAARGLKGLGVADPIVTLGPAGVVCFDHGRAVHVPAPQVEDVVETTGAGDAFVGALACYLRAGVEMAESVAIAGRYAALAVLRPGTRDAYVDRAALRAAAFPPDAG